MAIAVRPAGLAAQAGSVSGTVRSAATGEALSYPRVRALGLSRQTVGDSAGGFALADLPPGNWRLEVRRIGYRSDTLGIVVLVGQVARVDVRLVPEPVEVAAVTARSRESDRARFEEEAVVSTRSLDIRAIRGAPGLAETDLMRTVQLLPGVVARNDYSVGLNVRGGDADQNLVLLDGAVIFNPFHLGGVVSTFDDAALAGLDFLAGGFPARYGGRLSSVLDVSARDGRPGRLRGTAAASLVSSKLQLEGALPWQLGSWLIAGRRTYADQLVKTFTTTEFPYHFQDLLARATLPAVPGGVLTATGFASGDFFNFTLSEATSGGPAQSFRFDWGNSAAVLTYRRAAGPRGVLTHRLSASGFSADIDVGPGLIFFGNRVRRLALEGELEVRSPAHTLAAGYLLEHHAISYTVLSSDLGQNFGRLSYRPLAVEAWADEQWRPWPWLLVRPGLRGTYVSGASFVGLAPRLAFKAFVGPDLALTGSVGRFYQHIHSLRDEEIPITLFEFWVGSDSAIPVSAADHAVLGVERWVGRGLSLSVEGFLKRMRNLVDQNPAADPAVPGSEFRTARGDAYGADLYVRKTSGRLTGWIAYGFAKVTRETDDGERFAPAQDRRHTFNVVASFRGPLGADWSVRWGYGSPLPYTGMAGQFVHRFYDPARNIFVGGFVEPYRTARNALRYPAYSRLDVRARWSFRWLGAAWHPSAQLLNAYARNNVFVYFYDYTENPPLRRGLTQFPLLPTVGLEVEF